MVIVSRRLFLYACFSFVVVVVVVVASFFFCFADTEKEFVMWLERSSANVKRIICRNANGAQFFNRRKMRRFQWKLFASAWANTLCYTFWNCLSRKPSKWKKQKKKSDSIKRRYAEQKLKEGRTQRQMDIVESDLNCVWMYARLVKCQTEKYNL